MEVKVIFNDNTKKIELGDVVVINADEETHVTLASFIQGRSSGEFCLVNINGKSVWTSAKTLELLNKDVRSNDVLFIKYYYTIYKANEYELQLIKK